MRLEHHDDTILDAIRFASYVEKGVVPEQRLSDQRQQVARIELAAPLEQRGQLVAGLPRSRRSRRMFCRLGFIGHRAPSAAAPRPGMFSG